MSEEKKIIQEPKIVVKPIARKELVNAASQYHTQEYVHEEHMSTITKDASVFDPNKKTILYIITKANWGGAQKYVYDLARHFKGEYNIAVAYGKNEFAGKNIFREHLDAIGVHVYPIGNLSKKIVVTNEIRAMFEMWSIIRKIKPNIIHLNSPKAGGLGGLVGYLWGVERIVYTVHGLNTFEDRKPYEITIINALTRMMMFFSHKIITISQVDKDKLISWGMKEKLKLIYNGLHPVAYTEKIAKRNSIGTEAPQPIALKLQDPATIVIGSIAEMTANKGLFYLLEALVILKNKNIPFVYIHYGTGDQEQLLTLELKQFGLTDYVLFKGFDAQAATYLSVFDIFTLPSLKEGLPYVLLEAAGAGKAVVASEVGGIPEIIEHERTGLLVPRKNSEELARAIERLIAHPELRTQYGEALKQHVANEFSLETMFDLTREVYTS